MGKSIPIFILPVVLAAALLFSGSQAPSSEEELWRHRNLGKALFENPAALPRAVEELKKALDLAPGSFRDRLNYGLALFRAGDLEKAVAELEKAQKQNPALPHTWFNLGLAYKRLGRYPEAILEFERMIRLAAGDPVSHYNLGMLYNLTGRKEDALKQFEAAAALDDKLAAPRFQIYNYYRLADDAKRAAKAFAAFQKAKQAQAAAGDSEDMEWSYYAELYDPRQAPPAGRVAGTPADVKFRDETLPGRVEANTAGLAVIDAFGEAHADLLAWSRQGILLYRSGRQPVAGSGLEAVKDVVAIAPGDFDNDGLTDLCVLAGSGPVLFRNAKGKFERQEARLPARRFEAAVWLDFDHDYDLDLFLLGEKSALFRNEGGALADYTAHFPFVTGHATSAVPLRVIADTTGADLAVSYSDRQGVLYLDRMRAVYQAVPAPALPAGARSLAAIDADNDAWVDLAFASKQGVALAMNRAGRFDPAKVLAAGASGFAFADFENRGFEDMAANAAVHRNQGLSRFAPGARIPAFVCAAAADFDRDGRADLAEAEPDGSLHLLTNRTETRNHWIAVALDGVKNVKSAAGAEVELRAGDHYQKQSYAGVPLLFGLGARAEADTVRINWPNGQIQNEVRQAASRLASYKEAPRMAGSCPMVFVWNGNRFEFISDVLGVAPLGASSGDGEYFPVDSDEYLELPPGVPAVRGGKYEIRITEELHEVSYIDQARLIAVDHPAAVEVFTNDKFKSPPFPEFRLFGVTRRIYPMAARDGSGRDVLDTLLRIDRRYASGFRHDAAGVAETHALELKFPATAARDNRAVLIMNGWIDWADGSTFLAASQGGRGGLVMPYLQVKDSAGRWRTVIEDMGIPSGGPKTIAVDLTGKFLSASRDIRIVTNVCLYWDQIFLSENTAPPAVRMTALEAVQADLRLRGFSKVLLDPRREQPESYDYSEWRPAAMWNPVPGLYTRFGDVRELVANVDDRLVLMGSGDELRLAFDASRLPPLPAGWRRDFLFLVDGWSKDADANTAFGDSVEPLPFHGMSRYPYAPGEHFPDDAAHRAWRAKYNTRRGMRLIEALRACGAQPATAP
jgi:tetratricopeptide (TPR) repeat protein